MTSSQSQNPYVYCMNNPLRYVDPTGMMGDIPRMSLDEWLGPSDRSASDLLNEMRASQDYFSGLAEEAYHDIMFGSDDYNYQNYDNNVVLPGPPKNVYENHFIWTLGLFEVDINIVQEPNRGEWIIAAKPAFGPNIPSAVPGMYGHETEYLTINEYEKSRETMGNIRGHAGVMGWSTSVDISNTEGNFDLGNNGRTSVSPPSWPPIDLGIGIQAPEITIWSSTRSNIREKIFGW